MNNTSVEDLVPRTAPKPSAIGDVPSVVPSVPEVSVMLGSRTTMEKKANSGPVGRLVFPTMKEGALSLLRSDSRDSGGQGKNKASLPNLVQMNESGGMENRFAQLRIHKNVDVQKEETKKISVGVNTDPITTKPAVQDQLDAIYGTLLTHSQSLNDLQLQLNKIFDILQDLRLGNDTGRNHRPNTEQTLQPDIQPFGAGGNFGNFCQIAEKYAVRNPLQGNPNSNHKPY